MKTKTTSLASLLALLALAVSLPVQSQPAKKAGTGPRPRDQAPSWLMPPVTGPNLHYKTFASRAAGTNVSYLLYLPPDYETAKDRRYPVVYWLHGIGGSQQGVPTMAERLTQAIADGKTPAMIVVYVNGMIRSGWSDGQYPVETVAIKELIPHIDATYRTTATRAGRMVEGFSMGGSGAAKWGLKYPELFGSISILDGALHVSGGGRGGKAEASKADDGAAKASSETNDPWQLAEKNAEKVKGHTTIRIVTRTAGLSGTNEKFHELLDRLGLSHEFHKIPDAPHSPNPLYEGLGDKNWEFYRKAFGATGSGTGSSERTTPARAAQSRLSPKDQEAVRSDLGVPGQGQRINAPPGVKLIRDLAYREGNPAWKLDLAMPEKPGTGPRPGIVFVHGGGWRGGDKGQGYFLQGALDYAQKGYVCTTVNYRLTGETPFPACVEDVKCAVRWLRAHAKEYNLDPNRLGAYGNSAGAHLVAMLGLAGREAKLEGDGPYQDQSSLVQAVCPSAVPTDFANWGEPGKSFRGESTLLAGSPETLADRKKLASPISHVSAQAPPFLIIHGTADGVVPFTQATTFVDALKKAGAKDVTFLPVEGEGHGVFMQRAELTQPAMEKFFARVLKP